MPPADRLDQPEVDQLGRALADLLWSCRDAVELPTVPGPNVSPAVPAGTAATRIPLAEIEGWIERQLAAAEAE